MKRSLGTDLIDRLKNLAIRLIDQRECVRLVDPQGNSEGFWFGGGNLIQQKDGTVLACGRYRNHGDARTGVGAGDRGLEFAVFALSEDLRSACKIFSLSKDDLSYGEPVVSIEGGCLLAEETGDAVELFVSTEKKKAYPKEFINFQKPGTGVWSVDLLRGRSGVSSISTADARVIVSSEDADCLHVKDPVAFRFDDEATQLLYCHHSFAWSSSNTGLASRHREAVHFSLIESNALPRGNSWDVACSRITERLPVPRIGPFADLPELSLYFYDGAECLRALDENKAAARRPRGYSCEELGGLAWGWDQEFPKMNKISTCFPLFVSPHGTGCSRYVSALNLKDGSILAGWQQSQRDLSQPLVVNRLKPDAVRAILS